MARHPIVTRSKELFAYEFLLQGEVDEEMNTTSYLLDNVLKTIGVEKMEGNSLAFLNCDYDFLLSDIPDTLNPHIYAFEIMATILIDNQIIDIIKNLHQKGFRIALDDFELSQETFALINPIISCLSYCKVEYPRMKNSKILPKLVEIFHKYKIQVIMKKIETVFDFKACCDVGADFFQGYFFAKPEKSAPLKIKADTMGALQVLNMMSGNYLDLEMDSLEKEFKKYPELIVNLLKYLNSVHFGMRSKITSIRHALSMLGFSKIKRWLLILAYDNNSDVSLEKSPLLINAMTRANFFGSVAKKLGWTNERMEKAFLMGLVSHLDALYQTTMENILENISLDSEITKALLEGEGDMGLLLNIVSVIEQGDTENVSGALNALHLTQKDVNECLIIAYTNSLAVV
ncbi:MAG: HDOD domain-containing protein [Candidatus Fibromonas sp.]|jgi:EAL and modified HD-GYP domain-containing signal transduction protein|nr:HDOD domain-containing protein [Candidatus Fibromonas sp.]